MFQTRLLLQSSYHNRFSYCKPPLFWLSARPLFSDCAELLSLSGTFEVYHPPAGSARRN